MSLIEQVRIKNLFLDTKLAEFEKELLKLEPKIRNVIIELAKKGDIRRETIQAAVNSFYYPIADKFINNYNEVLPYIKAINDELGVAVVLPRTSLAMIDVMRYNNEAMLKLANETIINDMTKAVLRYTNESPSFYKLVKGLEADRINSLRESILTNDLDETLRLMRQRVASEANTGLATYERGIKDMQYKEAGIELFTYIGPSDKQTRTACANTLADRRNKTGFTRSEIDNELDVDMLTGGGYNCRHDFYPVL